MLTAFFIKRVDAADSKKQEAQEADDDSQCTK